jgi:hypothetical protein
MRKTLVDERTAFLQRIHAQLFHHDILRRSATCSRQGSPGAT